MKLLERDIQKACEDILLLDGWALFHPEYNWSEKKRKATGQLGAADTQALRPTWNLTRNGEIRPTLNCHVLFIEWKRKQGMASAGQKAWHREMRLKGFVTWIAKEDFEPTFEGFCKKYEQSGLLRREGLVA